MNGEIYNYLELRSGMTAPEGGFRSMSDTEVLVEAIDRQGVAAIDSMVGMFAVAVWRPLERELWLIRDRLGKKPLYHARTPAGGVRFASEFGAHLEDGALTRTTTLDRIAEYLQHGYVAAPRTGLCEISVVPPGSWLRIRLCDNRAKLELRRYWKLPVSVPQASNAGAWREEFHATLDDAVRIRLRSDTPLGAFLSGGVDSSVVSLLATRHLSHKLRTYTADFAESGFSEGRYAADVARQLGTDHTQFEVTRDAIGSISDLVGAYGDLHGDSSAVPMMALCRVTRQHVTVALAGDGGDELLGGSGRYHYSLRMVEASARLPELVLAAARTAGAHALPSWVRGGNRLARVSRDLGYYYARDVRSYPRLTWPEILKRPRGAAWLDAVETALAHEIGRPPLLRLMSCDVQTYLPEDILVKVDRASMAVGLEVRAPLLDHRLMEISMISDPSRLIAEGRGKRPLKRRYGSALPRAVFERRKMGFAVPLGDWFRRDIESAETRLLDPGGVPEDLFARGSVRKLLPLHRARLCDNSTQIWQLLVLHAWFDRWRPSVMDLS